MPVSTNKPDPATLASGEALAALGVGDTALARKKYAEAGAILERDMKAHHGGEKHLLRFLAATQYYKGGDYQKALELAKKIDAGALPKNVRGLLPQFLKDVKERASPGYAVGVRRTLHSLWLKQEYQEALAHLQQHPYVVDAAGLAFMRATLCERLGDYRAAALFFRTVMRLAPGIPDTILMCTAYPLLLTTQGNAEEAWKDLQHQLEVLPHPIIYVTASVVCYHRSVAATSEERPKRFEEQLHFLEKAWESFQQLPDAERNHPDLRAYVAFGLEVAAGAWLLRGNKERGKEVWERAIQLDSNHASPWTAHDFAASPREQKNQGKEAEYLSEREAHFSRRFAPERAIRQQLETVGA